VTALIERKSNGSFYSIDELEGTARRDIRANIKLADHTFLGVVQARPESSGDVEKNGSDAGGQIFLFNIDLNQNTSGKY